MKYDYERVVNLTGHDVTVIQWNNEEFVLEPDGMLRVDSDMANVGAVRVGDVSIPLLEITEGQLELPDPQDGVLYIVSGVVAAKANRDDFVVPARVVRARDGTIRGCRAFARVRV